MEASVCVFGGNVGVLGMLEEIKREKLLFECCNTAWITNNYQLVPHNCGACPVNAMFSVT